MERYHRLMQTVPNSCDRSRYPRIGPWDRHSCRSRNSRSNVVVQTNYVITGGAAELANQQSGSAIDRHSVRQVGPVKYQDDPLALESRPSLKNEVTLNVIVLGTHRLVIQHRSSPTPLAPA